MQIQMLSFANVDMLVDFEKKARTSEPNIFLHDFDAYKFKAETIKALTNPHFVSAKCMMCVEKEKALGRLDFVMLPSYAFGGELRAYVDWIYVLKEHRHKGVAQFLFKEMTAYLTKHDTKEFFLIAAENKEAQRFYNSIQDMEIVKQDVLTKAL